MTGVYACLCETVCDVTTVPSHLNLCTSAAHTHTYTHTHSCMYTHTLMYVHTHTLIHAHTHIHVHTLIQVSHTHTHTHTQNGGCHFDTPGSCSQVDCTAFRVPGSIASNPGPHHFDPSARPSWRRPGKTAGHLGNCKVDGSVRSQFSPFFTLTVARVPCYEMSRAYITNLLLVLATTCRFLWASTKPSCLEHVEEKSSIDKQSDSIGNQTVEIGVRVRVSKSRFWCRFWSCSCVISVSTDSQKKKLKKKSRSTKTSWTPQAWWKSSESVDLRKVYGNPTCTILFVDLPSRSSNMRSPSGYYDDGENTWRLGVRFFFISRLKLATHRQP